MTPDELEAHTLSRLEELQVELSDDVAGGSVMTVGWSRYEELCRDATVTDFIPLLVYRYTKESLLTADSRDLHHAA